MVRWGVFVKMGTVRILRGVSYVDADPDGYLMKQGRSVSIPVKKRVTNLTGTENVRNQGN